MAAAHLRLAACPCISPGPCSRGGRPQAARSPCRSSRGPGVSLGGRAAQRQRAPSPPTPPTPPPAPPVTAASCLGRRGLLGSALAAMGWDFWGGESRPALAAEEEEEDSIVEGTITIKPGTPLPTDPRAALYVTARTPRGPTIAAIRRPLSEVEFPYDFKIPASELYPPPAGKGDELGWKYESLIVSARVDSDGVAATREEDNLVGRGLAETTGSGAISMGFPLHERASLELTGRGIGGKLVTRNK